MAKYPMPISLYLRQKQAAERLQKVTLTKFDAVADTLLPGWNNQNPKPMGSPPR